MKSTKESPIQSPWKKFQITWIGMTGSQQVSYRAALSLEKATREEAEEWLTEEEEEGRIAIDEATGIATITLNDDTTTITISEVA